MTKVLATVALGAAVLGFLAQTAAAKDGDRQIAKALTPNVPGDTLVTRCRSGRFDAPIDTSVLTSGHSSSTVRNPFPAKDGGSWAG
jgi:hypothetical protein